MLDVPYGKLALNIEFHLFQKPVAEAMREMLESFRLPGESQQIERITETFAAHYLASNPGEEYI